MTELHLLVAIISVGVALASLFKFEGRRTHEDIGSLRGELDDLATRMTNFEVSMTERMSRLEALFEGFTRTPRESE